MQRYFLAEPYRPQPVYTLTGETYHHIARVMRMKPEAEIYLVFADQRAIVAAIKEITEEAVLAVELRKEALAKELPVTITIASGYPKGDKLELIVQKGTELGAAAFIGFPATSSVVKWDEKKLNKKQQRLAKIAQEAAEQSQRQAAPAVELLASKKQLQEKLSEFDAVFVAYEEAAKQGEKAQLAKLLQQVQPGAKILAVFGPEGGLTEQEVAAFTAAGAITGALGPRILRTETAPFYFLAAASYQLELL